MTKRTTERKAVAPVALRRKSKIRDKMSMQSWTIPGFGVKEETFDKASTDDKIRFIKTYLPKVYEEMQADGENDENTDMSNTSDYIDFCKEWINDYEDEYCNMGFAAMFANAINEHEEGFDVVYANGEYFVN